jgi:uncharacterized protein with von Willebrand factor type A (vWA) domain
MSFLDDLSKNTKKGNFQPLRKFLDKKESVVKHDRFDAEAYKNVLNEAGELQKIGEVGKGATPQFPALLRDAYFSLFKADPKLENVDSVVPSSLLHHAVMEKGMTLAEWEELRTFCMLDEWSSAMATISFSEPLEQLTREMKELFDKVEEMYQDEQALRDMLDQMDTLEDQQGMTAPGSAQGQQIQGQKDALHRAIQDRLNELLRGNDELKKMIQDKANEIRQNVRKATQQAVENMTSESEMADAWGQEPGALTRMPYEQRMEMARRVRRSPKLKKLAKLTGRIKRLAMGEQSKKIIHGRDEAHDVELGSDLGRVLPAEFLDLMDPDREGLFMKKFVEQQLLQVQMRGIEKVGRGPIIVAMDQSGSMSCSDKDGYSREMWAKATALALLDIAKSQGRNFYGINFSHARSDMMEFSFPKGVGTFEQILDYAELFINGGTDFEHPLDRAVELIHEENKLGLEKADVVFITDGCCNVSPEWLQKYNENRELLEIRVFGVFVAGPRMEYDAGGWEGVMGALCDTVLSVDDMTTAEDSRDIYGTI